MPYGPSTEAGILMTCYKALFNPRLYNVVQVLDRVAAADIITAEFNIIFLVNHSDDRQSEQRGPFLQFLEPSCGAYSIGVCFVKQIREILYELFKTHHFTNVKSDDIFFSRGAKIRKISYTRLKYH